MHRYLAAPGLGKILNVIEESTNFETHFMWEGWNQTFPHFNLTKLINSSSIDIINFSSFDWHRVFVLSAHLVPKEDICLAKLKLFNLVFLTEMLSHHVEASEYPAPPWALLLWNWLYFCTDLLIIFTVWEVHIQCTKSVPTKV